MTTAIDFAPGDTIKVNQRIREGEKTRVQIFKGKVLQIRGRGENKTFTVQKQVGNVLVERIWPINSPAIVKIEIDEHPRRRVRRARLKHLAISKTKK